MSGVIQNSWGSTRGGIIGRSAYEHTYFTAWGASQTHTISSSTTCDFCLSSQLDPGGNVSDSGTTVYTVPEDGFYYFFATHSWGNAENDTVSRYVHGQIVCNGTSIAPQMLQAMCEITDGWGAGNSYWQMSTQWVREMNVGDAVKTSGSMGGSGNFDATLHGDSNSFGGWRLG